MEEDKYEPTKLPAPEESESIYMNNYDVAVLMQKNSQGIWEKENYYYAKEQPSIIPDGWIIVVTDDGVVKHYRYVSLLLYFFNVSIMPILKHTKKITSSENTDSLKIHP